jgi:hypothetical protein
MVGNPIGNQPAVTGQTGIDPPDEARLKDNRADDVETLGPAGGAAKRSVHRTTLREPFWTDALALTRG